MALANADMLNEIGRIDLYFSLERDNVSNFEIGGAALLVIGSCEDIHEISNFPSSMEKTLVGTPIGECINSSSLDFIYIVFFLLHCLLISV